MKSIIFILSLVILHSSFAQNNEKEDVLAVVENVFVAMRTNDSTLLKSSFTENPTTYTVMKNKEGITDLVSGDFQRFADAIGRKKEQTWSEPIWNERIEIDGKLASVWTDYAFYVDDKFSHCGVDAFHLIKKDGRWKIFHLVDTRRTTDCEIPDEIKP